MAFETTFSELNSRHPPAAGPERWTRLLLGAVDASLAGCIFAVPMMLGGRHALGHFVLALAAAAAATAWWCRQCFLQRPYWRRSAAHLLLLAAIGLVAVQVTPLPDGWIARLAPKTAEMLPLWGSDGSESGLGPWRLISLAPEPTRAGLLLLLCYAIVFWVTVQRIRNLDDVEKLLRFTALSALAMAAFGIVQYLASNEKFFWVYEHPFAVTSDGAKGAFTNRNHFAHFLAMGLGPVVWWVQNSLRRGRREHAGFRTASTPPRVGDFGAGARLIALGVLIFGILLSLSRGGAIAGGLAAAASIAVCYRAGSLRGRFALGLAAVALLLVASLSIVGHDRVTERLEGLASGSWDEVDRSEGRRTIWKTTLAAIPDFRWAGSGIGSFREVYPMYLQGRGNAEYYTHAENGYLQVALETGLAGALLMGLAIAVCGYWSVAALRGATSTRMFVAAGAAASVLLVSVVHSAVDFVWYAPGCLVIAVIMAACVCRLRQFTRGAECRQRDRFVLPRAAAWLSAAAAAGLGVWLVASQFGPLGAESHWLSYERLSRAAYLQSAMKPAADEDLLPEDPAALAAAEEEAEAARKAAEMEAEQRMAAELLETVRWNPRHARAHLALAASYMRLFHFAQETAVNRMPLSQIRDAAIAAGYGSRAELNEWLAKSVGEHYVYLDRALDHTRQSLNLCPLLGEGYLYLGELCFLEGAQGAAKSAYVQQALRVRPHDGTVLFHAGREAWLAGRPDEGLTYWKRSFEAGPIYQRQVIDWMAGRTAEVALRQEIGFFLEEFQPNLDALQYMYHRYRRIATPEQLAPLLAVYAQRAQGEAGSEAERGAREQAAERWLQAMAALVDLGQTREAVACAVRAAECNPNNFRARYKAGCLLADAGQLGDSEEHLAWCVRCKPDHLPARRRLAEVKKRILDPQGLSARTPAIPVIPGGNYHEARLHVPGPSTLPVIPAPGAETGPPMTVYRR